jgi:signal transduction histidine kinase
VLVRVFSDPSRLFYQHVPDLWRECGHLALSFLLVLPLALFDMLRYSQRSLGALFRLRREMNALANGENVEHLTFRGKDEWSELADSFNRIAAELRQARQRTSLPEPDEDRDDVHKDELQLSGT